ncbi:hypothetical protein CU016_1002 [Enterococcus lactis]|nr:hypothetical protein [Enterococcus lactis]
MRIYIRNKKGDVAEKYHISFLLKSIALLVAKQLFHDL